MNGLKRAVGLFVSLAMWHLWRYARVHDEAMEAWAERWARAGREGL